ncbi:restriction endonuclease [Salinibacterium sp. SWN1162]|uniref:restriction endonuclease n=1 Tax=Salinibacterium sp. SWN1162 TaxID=2792053 RepID=UPI0018CC964B|nr:restriction endonuclease [Salinibacterium sp. SWN1162]MBH0007970.1 restriction endonuclease [Salinibacterium sp. SWN1162]
MRSVNSARELGAKFARNFPDLRASDADIRTAVDSILTPQIKLNKSDLERKADQRGALAAVGVMSALVLGGVAYWYGKSEVVVVKEVTDSIPVLWAAAIVFLVLSVTVFISFSHIRQEANDARFFHIVSMRKAAFEGAIHVLDRRRRREGISTSRGVARDSARPDRISTGVTPRGAESLVAQWMRHLGEVNAEVTPFRGDGGVDVAGGRYIAQVKHFAGSVGVAPVRELAGVASDDGRLPLFFTSTGYSSGAVAFANRLEIALFVYDVAGAELRAVNPLALTLLKRGLGQQVT